MLEAHSILYPFSFLSLISPLTLLPIFSLHSLQCRLTNTGHLPYIFSHSLVHLFSLQLLINYWLVISLSPSVNLYSCPRSRRSVLCPSPRNSRNLPIGGSSFRYGDSESCVNPDPDTEFCPKILLKLPKRMTDAKSASTTMKFHANFRKKVMKFLETFWRKNSRASLGAWICVVCIWITINWLRSRKASTYCQNSRNWCFMSKCS